MSRYRTSLLLSGAAITLGLATPAVAQSWVPPKPFARNTPYVAGDMHNHTTCTDGSVSTSYLLDRSMGSGSNGGVPNFNIDWFNPRQPWRQRQSGLPVQRQQRQPAG